MKLKHDIYRRRRTAAPEEAEAMEEAGAVPESCIYSEIDAHSVAAPLKDIRQHIIEI